MDSVDRHKILLSGIPGHVTEEQLSLFIEDRTQIHEDPKIFYGDRQGIVLLDYEQEIPDQSIESFAEKKIEEHNVQAERVKPTNKIFVRNLDPSTNEEFLRLYFENKRKSGGVLVKKVTKEGNTAIIEFRDCEVVNSVIRRNHLLSDANLIVTPYYEFLVTKVSTREAKYAHLQPIILTVDPRITQFLVDRPSLHQELSEVLATVGVSFQWPYNDDKTKAEFSPSSDDQVGNTTCDEFSRNVLETFLVFCQTYTTEETSFCSNDICIDYNKVLNSFNNLSFQVDRRGTSTNLVLTGLRNEVQNAKKCLQQTKKVISLSTLKINRFIRCEIEKHLNKLFLGVRITPSFRSKAVAFEGLKDDVGEAIVCMYSEIDELVSITIQHDISGEKYRFIKHAKHIIQKRFIDKNLRVTIELKGGLINLYGPSKEETQNAVDFLNEIVKEDSIQFDEGSRMAELIYSRKVNKELDNIKSEGNVMIARTQHRIQAAGFREEVEKTMIRLNLFLKANEIVDLDVSLPILHARFLHKYCGKELEAIKREHDINVRLHTTGRNSRHTLALRGSTLEVYEAQREIKDMSDNLLQDKYAVGTPGMVELFKSPKGHRYLKIIADESDCVITLENIDEEIQPTRSIDNVHTLHQLSETTQSDAKLVKRKKDPLIDDLSSTKKTEVPTTKGSLSVYLAIIARSEQSIGSAKQEIDNLVRGEICKETISNEIEMMKELGYEPMNEISKIASRHAVFLNNQILEGRLCDVKTLE